MYTMLEGVVKFFRNLWDGIKVGWAKLNEQSRWVLAIAIGVELFGLFFTNGIMYNGAVFAMAMILSLGILCYSVPPLLKFLANHYIAIDFFMTISTLIIGFFLGPTMAVSLLFFGLCLSGSLRLVSVVGMEYGKNFTWDQILPARMVAWFKKPEEKPETIPVLDADQA